MNIPRFSFVAPFALAVLLPLVMGGCTSDEDVKNELSLGMSKVEVKAAVGSPDDVQSMNSTGMSMEMWYYNSIGGMVQVVFNNGKVTAINDY